MSQEIRILVISILTGVISAGWFLILWYLITILLKNMSKK